MQEDAGFGEAQEKRPGYLYVLDVRDWPHDRFNSELAKELGWSEGQNYGPAGPWMDREWQRKCKRRINQRLRRAASREARA